MSDPFLLDFDLDKTLMFQLIVRSVAARIPPSEDHDKVK